MFWVIVFIISILFILFLIKIKVKLDTLSLAFKILSLMINTDINNIKNVTYNYIFDKLLKRIQIFNNNDKNYFNINDFEKDFWITLANSKYFEYHKDIMDIIVSIINKNYQKILYLLFKQIFILPLIIYKVYKDSASRQEFIYKLLISESLTKAYQISSIMNVDLYTTIKRVRLSRNLPGIDKNTGLKMITRQVRFPMIGSNICPFINYVNKCEISNKKIKYSILIIEKNLVLDYQQYKCEIHESCVLYKYLNNSIKHLEECEFWKDDKYWETKYPKEKELII